LTDRISSPVASNRHGATLDELMTAVAAGEVAAFEEVYRRTSAKLFGVCLRILPERHEAEDALQTVFLSVWRHAARFDARRGTPMTWLLTLARNRAIDRLRANRAVAELPIMVAETVPDPAPIASDLIDVAGEARRLRECLDGLDRDDAGFIRTAFFEGSTYAELAVRAKLPLGTLKSRIRRALLGLRDCLG
jgi:RNA polymerase sigma-70 factor (ECF subfamily)